MKRLPNNSVKESSGSPRDGMSLIELTVVVLILGIMAAVASPRYFDAMEYHRAEATAKRVRSDLAVAQRTAKLTSAVSQVAFSTNSNGYKMLGVNDPDHPGVAYAVQLANTGYAATLVSVDFGGTTIVNFDRYGRPDNGGTVVVRAGRYQKTIVVDATTGRAAIQ